MDTYNAIHKRLLRERGPAKDHICPCGETAEQWAYQYTDADQELRAEDGSSPHSTNIEDYLPMCRGCHRRFDLEHDEVLRERIRQGEATKRRWAEDEEYAEKMKGVLRANLDSFVERRKNDPELNERMREAARRGVQSRVERMKVDPEYRERFRRSGKNTAELAKDPKYAEMFRRTGAMSARIRVRCSECGMESNRGGIGTHQVASGHEGREPV